MKNPHILTLDLSAIGATSLYELRDTLAAEFDANKDSASEFAERAAVASGVALKQLDKYLEETETRRPKK